jgi:hypothetical protein
MRARRAKLVLGEGPGGTPGGGGDASGERKCEGGGEASKRHGGGEGRRLSAAK